MSLVIAIKDGDRFVIGADKQGTSGGNRVHTAVKVWSVKGYKECVMGGVGFMRANQVMQYFGGLIDRNDFENGELNITEEYVAMVLAPTIFGILESAGIVAKTEDEGCSIRCIPNSFIFAFKDKAWLIGHDLVAEEISDYVAIGSGAEIARGVLYATKDKNPFERIAMAIDAASLETTSVDDYLDVLTTKEREDDQKLFNQAMYDQDEINSFVTAIAAACECGYECEECNKTNLDESTKE